MVVLMVEGGRCYHLCPDLHSLTICGRDYTSKGLWKGAMSKWLDTPPEGVPPCIDCAALLREGKKAARGAKRSVPLSMEFQECLEYLGLEGSDFPGLVDVYYRSRDHIVALCRSGGRGLSILQDHPAFKDEEWDGPYVRLVYRRRE